jgi:hypothetical protein
VTHTAPPVSFVEICYLPNSIKNRSSWSGF